MNIAYRACKTLIENGRYESKEEMQEKLDTFYAFGRLSQDEYTELTKLLASK